MFILRFLGSLFKWIWRQLRRFLNPFRDNEEEDTSASLRFSSSHRGIDGDFRFIPDVVTDTQHSLTFDFEDFTLMHSSNALKVCAFYFVGYLLLAVIFFSFVFEQWSIIDSLYFSIVLLTTIGYGDIAPSNDTTRLFLIWFAMYGVAILGIFLGIVGHTLAEMQQRAVERLQAASTKMTLKAISTDVPVTEMMPATKHKSLAQDVLDLICLESPIVIIVLVVALSMGYVEGWSIIQSIYYAVISITTIGLGDITPEKEGTRLFGVIFLPLAVCVFGEVIGRIANLYVSRKMRKLEHKFLRRSITLLDLQVMDADKNGLVSMEEFLVFMLVALQKVDKETIDDLRALFRSLDVTRDGNLGKDDLIRTANSRPGWSSIKSVRDLGLAASEG
jgi:potassium channel subfamily K